MKSPTAAAVKAKSAKKSRQKPEQYFMARHRAEMVKYHGELTQEIQDLETASDAIDQKVSEAAGFFSGVGTIPSRAKLPGMKKELELKRAKLKALKTLQTIGSYAQLETFLKNVEADKNLRSGKRFNDILVAVEVYAYHDDLPLFNENHDHNARLPNPYCFAPETFKRSREMDANPQSDYFQPDQKAHVVQVRDDLQCAINKFDHVLYLQFKAKHKLPALTAGFLKERSFKRMQVDTLNDLLSTVNSKEALANWVKAIIQQYLNLPYVLGNFNTTPCSDLLDPLLKEKGFYFCFKDLFEIYRVQHELSKERDYLSQGYTPAWVNLSDAEYKRTWIEEECRVKGLKIQALESLLKIDNLVKLQRFSIDLLDTPEVLQGHPSRVKKLLDTLITRYSELAMTEGVKGRPKQGRSPHVLLPAAHEQGPQQGEEKLVNSISVVKHH